ncbi:hypothetical protein HPULCUR_001764 [Helicostylum pulchrum]|uniref:Uncharacterized protein n=1 Tax=Helicostylum pulchrum TaxID=562976 RepID=A0ABP9XNL3_9FUNG
MEFLQSICLNEDQVKLLSESRNVCTALRMKKTATRSVPFGELEATDKTQMVNLVTIICLVNYSMPQDVGPYNLLFKVAGQTALLTVGT